MKTNRLKNGLSVAILAAAAILGWSAAASPIPGEVCSTAGTMTVNTKDGVLSAMSCNGTIWENSSIQVGMMSGVVCNGDNEGVLRYNKAGKEWTYCDGTNYVPFESAAGTAKVEISAPAAVLFPGTASCTAPNCAAGSISKGCQYGASTGLLNDVLLRSSAHEQAVTRMNTVGWKASDCSYSQTAALLGLYARVVCLRLCVSTS